MPTAEYAWQAAERRCFDYLLTVLSGVEDDDAFLGAIPRTFPDSTAGSLQWSFAMGGGGNVHVPNPTVRGQITSWHNDAMWEGVFITRADAVHYIGLLRDALPAGPADIAGVQKLYISAHPTIEQAAVEIESDATSGGQVPAWRVVVPMSVAYENADQVV